MVRNQNLKLYGRVTELAGPILKKVDPTIQICLLSRKRCRYLKIANHQNGELNLFWNRPKESNFFEQFNMIDGNFTLRFRVQ